MQSLSWKFSKPETLYKTPQKKKAQGISKGFNLLVKWMNEKYSVDTQEMEDLSEEQKASVERVKA